MCIPNYRTSKTVERKMRRWWLTQKTLNHVFGPIFRSHGGVLFDSVGMLALTKSTVLMSHVDA